MTPKEAMRLKQALDIYVIATSESRWNVAVDRIAEAIDELLKSERLRNARACDHVASEWLREDACEGDELCRSLRAQAAESAMLCAGRIAPDSGFNRCEQIAEYRKKLSS